MPSADRRRQNHMMGAVHMQITTIGLDIASRRPPRGASLGYSVQGYSVSTEREEGNKKYRADPFAAQCEHGLVKLVEAAWNRPSLRNSALFPIAPMTTKSTQPLPHSVP